MNKFINLKIDNYAGYDNAPRSTANCPSYVYSINVGIFKSDHEIIKCIHKFLNCEFSQQNFCISRSQLRYFTLKYTSLVHFSPRFAMSQCFAQNTMSNSDGHLIGGVAYCFDV